MIPRNLPLDDFDRYNQLWAVVVDVFESAQSLMFSSGFVFLASIVIAVSSAMFIWRYARRFFGG